jgi:hypothetical protein
VTQLIRDANRCAGSGIHGAGLAQAQAKIRVSSLRANSASFGQDDSQITIAMKIDVILFALYAALLLLIDSSVTIQYLVAVVVLAMSVRRLVGAEHFYLSYGWLCKHQLQAISLAGLTLALVLMPFVLGPWLFKSAPTPLSNLPRILVGTPVVALWFWAFLAAGVRIRERRVNKLVEQRIAEMRGLEDGRREPADR